MSNRARGERRRAAQHRDEMLAQAHDRLHKDDPEGAHGFLHAALGVEEIPDDIRPLRHRDRFDASFRRLCVEHDVVASYVLVDEADGDRARLLSGGNADLCTQLDRILRASA